MQLNRGGEAQEPQRVAAAYRLADDILGALGKPTHEARVTDDVGLAVDWDCGGALSRTAKACAERPPMGLSLQELMQSVTWLSKSRPPPLLTNMRGRMLHGLLVRLRHRLRQS